VDPKRSSRGVLRSPTSYPRPSPANSVATCCGHAG